jgi:hypothetical protein
MPWLASTYAVSPDIVNARDRFRRIQVIPPRADGRLALALKTKSGKVLNAFR